MVGWSAPWLRGALGGLGLGQLHELRRGNLFGGWLDILQRVCRGDVCDGRRGQLHELPGWAVRGRHGRGQLHELRRGNLRLGHGPHDALH